MTLIVTPLFAAVAAFMLIWLSYRVVRQRRAKQISVGDANDRILLRAMRAQGNFVEYVPLTLLLMGLAELQGAPLWLVGLLGLALLAGRLLHALGLSQEPDNFTLRVRGMYLTIAALAGAACLCFALSVRTLLTV